MSSKSTKKNNAAPKQPNAIITRNKSAQQSRQLRPKSRKNDKPVKQIITITKPEIKSPKVTKSDTCSKDTPLKKKVRHLAQLVEQVEYHPDKLKRDVCTKKILLKPKHNFKVVAAANKRKLGVPQKGGLKSPLPQKRLRGTNFKTPNSSNSSQNSEVSMVDMVRLIEDNHSLSDEDFMEILTCPSPVWWEDPPDERYTEEAICKRMRDPSPPTSTQDSNTTEEQEDNTADTHTKEATSNTTAKKKPIPLIDFENEIDKFKIVPIVTNNDNFNIKKQKLENILGNIKNVKKVEKVLVKNGEKAIACEVKKPRKISTSTDGEDMSDLSINAEEILKNLETMDIPIQECEELTSSSDDDKLEIDLKDRERDNKTDTVIEHIPIKNNPEIPIKSELQVPDKLPPLTRKPDIKIENVIKSENSDSNSEFYLDNVSHSHFRFISDDDISSVEPTNGDEKVDKSSVGESSSVIDVDSIEHAIKEEYEIKKELIEIDNADNYDKNNGHKKASDISEYITVYKIMAQDGKNEISNDSINKTTDSSNNNVRGKLNNFFKKCKSNKRLKKSDSPFPAIPVIDVKDLKIKKGNSDDHASVENDENRLKPCDYCVVKTENGTQNFSCEKCETTPILTCDLCNFLADTKEIYKKHVSTCKDVARISWNNNYLTNQT